MYELIAPNAIVVTANERPQQGCLQPLLTVKNLSCSYASRTYGLFGKKEIKPVFNNINFEMNKGEIFGLAGSSGCGKSTLAQCILGLKNYKGEIAISGNKMAHNNKQFRERALMVQMVFQDPASSLNPTKKIGWLMEEPLIMHNLCEKDARQRLVDEMLVRIGLDPSYKTRRPDEISGGQKQRVCIGRALMLEPELLIADESISSLDVSAGAQILNLFRELNQHSGLGILFISHNINAVEYLCERVAVFRKLDI